MDIRIGKYCYVYVVVKHVECNSIYCKKYILQTGRNHSTIQCVHLRVLTVRTQKQGQRELETTYPSLGLNQLKKIYPAHLLAILGPREAESSSPVLNFLS